MKFLRQDVELLRLLSALGIVWFHCQVAGAEVGYGGLVFFLIATVYFGGRAKPLKQRAMRLLLPWSIWMIFYGVINLATGRPLVSYADGFLSKLLWGTANHLWYLPFAFVCLVLLDRLRPLARTTWLATSCGVAAMLMLAQAETWREWSFSLGFPWATFVHALPAVLLGVFFSGSDRLDKRLRWTLLSLIILACATTTSIPDQGVPYLVGVLAASVMLLPPNAALQKLDLSAISGLSLGIYLIHPFLLDVCLKFDLHLGSLHPPMIFLASAVLVWSVQKLLPRFAKYVV